jgi:hypothetical protein
MLLQTKIDELLAGEDNYISISSDILINDLNLKGIVDTKNMVMIDILYYLLNLNFVHKNINRDLYKYLKHFQDINVPIVVTESQTNIDIPPVVPTITTSVDQLGLDFGTVRVGNEKILSFTFEASAAFNKVLVSSNNEYLLSSDPVLNFSTQLLYLPKPSDGSLSISTVYVKYVPQNIGTDIDEITISIVGYLSIAVDLTGTGIESTLAATPNILSFPVTRVNIQSAPLSFAVTGTYLSTDVTLTAPTGYTISLTQSNYTSSITISPDLNNEIQPTTVYVVFTPVGSILYSGNITIANDEITAISVNLTGTGTQIRLDVTPLEIDLGDIYVGQSTSYPYPSFNVFGMELISDVVVTVPNISNSYSILYNYTDINNVVHSSATSYNMLVTNGLIDIDTDILFNCTLPIGNISLPITVSSNNVATQTVLLKANLITSTLEFIPTSIDFGSVLIGSKVERTVRLVGHGLYQGTLCVIQCLAGINTFSTTSMSDPGTTFLTFMQLNPSITGDIDITLYVQAEPNGTTLYTNYLSASETNVPGNIPANTYIPLTVTGINTIVSLSPNTLDFGNVIVNTTSSAQSLTLTGTNVVGNTTVSTSGAYTICKTLSGTYVTSLVYSSLELSNPVNLYVKFSPTSIQSYTDTVDVINGTASDTCDLSGSGIASGGIVTIARPGDTKVAYPSGTNCVQYFQNDVNALDLRTVNAFFSFGSGNVGRTCVYEIYNQSNVLLGSKSFTITDGNGMNWGVVMDTPIALTVGEVLYLKAYVSGGYSISAIGLSNNTDIPLAYRAVLDGVTQVYPMDIEITGTN